MNAKESVNVSVLSVNVEKEEKTFSICNGPGDRALFIVLKISPNLLQFRIKANIPNTWEMKEQDIELVFAPSLQENQAIEKRISVTNDNEIDFDGGYIVQQKLFRESKDYAEWITGILEHQDEMGSPFEEVDRIKVGEGEVPIFQL